ncbi:MAG: ABC transporter substrate-binding protein [Algoriphagus sp.]|uniref:ABC transporter substrate-binding protein n=1 Tax=Algoriphagus sp. TaxID=1872435 RepID=UPI0017C6C372|nr:ABC transporter substrate-binding protein [Algoriphagus sp.]NVJ87086.1 ABC transporter substrate-binding protein [Algoriphagus sp.]
MKQFRIVGVPEHFNLPFRILSQKQPFEKEGIHLEWIEESRGSGKMSEMLRQGEAEMGILLTESFFKEIAQGSSFKFVGFHVKSPLIWGIHCKKELAYSSVQEIPNPRFLISRLGSGSHLMASVLAEKLGWPQESIELEVVENLDGARKAFENGDEGLFLWEKYTTSPEVEKGNMKRIGEIASPWPCFVMVASQKAINDFLDFPIKVRDELYRIIKNLKSNPNLPEIISSEFHLNVNEVKSWIRQTEWSVDNQISRSEMEKITRNLKHFGIIGDKPKLEDFALIDSIQLRD